LGEKRIKPMRQKQAHVNKAAKGQIANWKIRQINSAKWQ
jgi:ribosomal protein S8E